MLGYSPSSLRDEPPGTRAALANLRRALALALAATLLATAISPCLGAPTVPGTNIVLGLLLPPEEAEAASLRDGVLLAVEDANASAGPRVNLAIRGRTGQWGADAVEAARMVLDDGAQALIAPPDGGATHLALQVAGRTTTPVVSLCPDSSVTKTGVPWMLRIAPTTIAEARFLLASLNSQTSSPPQWVAVVPDGRAGREISRDLDRAASAAHCDLKSVCIVSATLTNFDPIAAQVVKDQPRGVLIWLDPLRVGRMVRRLQSARFTGKMAGPSRCDSPAFLATAAQASEGFFVPAVALDDNGEARLRLFQAAFRQRYQIEADVTAAEAYDAAKLLVRIIASNDPQSLARAFPPTFSFPGASGDLSFDAEGNRMLGFKLLVARKGRFGPADGN